MPRRDIFPLVDRLVPGGLASFLAASRAADDSHETIAFRLRTEHDVEVSGETVRKWCRRTGVDKPPAEQASA